MGYQVGSQQVIADTHISELNPDIPQGSSSLLSVGQCASGGNVEARALLRFNVWSMGVSSGMPVHSAYLGVYAQATDVEGISLRGYHMTQPGWEEFEAEWGRYTTTQSWANAGGDYVSSWASFSGSITSGQINLIEGMHWQVEEAARASGQLDVLLELANHAYEGQYGVRLASRHYGVGPKRPHLVAFFGNSQ